MRLILALAFLLIFTSSSKSQTISGKASFYGGGKREKLSSRMANGERFNPNAMCVAHRTLPFGTKLLVKYRDKSVMVTVKDRGPFIHGRVLDLCRGAASVLGLLGVGVGHVEAVVVK